MHSYLVIGNKKENIDLEIKKLSSQLETKILEFPILKIEDVRELNKFLKVSFAEKTLIVCQDIDKASIESLNAFLKTLEEPQSNIFFCLTANNDRSVLSTIVSRCQVIKTKNGKGIENDVVGEFLGMNVGQKLQFFDKIKDRNDAISYIEDLIFFLHKKKEFNNMEILTKTLTRLKANGNVNLQLSNLAINFN